MSESLLQLSHPEAAGSYELCSHGHWPGILGYLKKTFQTILGMGPCTSQFPTAFYPWPDISPLIPLTPGQSLGAYCSQWENEEAETQRGYNKQAACII